MNAMTHHTGRVVWAGAGLWTALATVAVFTGAFGMIETLVMLAVLVVVPLALHLSDPAANPEPDNNRLSSLIERVGHPHTFAQRLQPFAAVLVPVAFLLPTGMMAGILALPWLLVCGLIALSGALAFYQRRARTIETFVMNAGLMMVPVGGVHLVLSRLGMKSAGFAEPIVLLTVIHFHYTAFAAPVMAAELGKRVRAALAPAYAMYAAVALGLVAATPLTAVGFLFSPLLKVIAAVLVCVSVMGLCLLALLAVSDLPNLAAKILITFSAICGALGMALAALYASGEFAGKLLITIPQMAAIHGVLNGLGFVSCGLLGWTLASRDTAVAAENEPAALMKGTCA